MPPNDSFGFDDDQCFFSSAPETTKHDPEKTVFCSNLRSFFMTFPDGQLLAERADLKTVDKDSINFQLLEDFSMWFWNYR
jgi:hypothetical protein